MKTKVGPAAIIIAAAALALFCYFMYRSTDTSSSSLGAYNPQKYGPPDYVKNMKKGGGPGYMVPHGQTAASPQ
ncbi:MAG TPA: hypothetical protein VFB21_01715 [Chthonomonadaceae bacterium]|jgi:hypothetical protein|nr:hypothetical protein [Chthonomonadaceae bacterium]